MPCRFKTYYSVATETMFPARHVWSAMAIAVYVWRSRKKKFTDKKTPRTTSTTTALLPEDLYTPGNGCPEKYDRVTTAADNKLSDDRK